MGKLRLSKVMNFAFFFFILPDLKKGTEYQVRVAAMTANGTGPHTPWLTARTFSEEFRGEGEEGKTGRQTDRQTKVMDRTYQLN